MNNKIKISILDTGISNLYNLNNAFQSIGYRTQLIDDISTSNISDMIVLPGVGAFEYGMLALNRMKCIEQLTELVGKGKPILGICLGMQLMLDRSFEHGVFKGLSFVDGDVIPIPRGKNSYKVPHVGWAPLIVNPDCLNTKNSNIIENGSWVYYTHSYYVQLNNSEECLGYSVYNDTNITGIFLKNNLCGCQFHPELSGQNGLNILNSIIQYFFPIKSL